MNSFITREATGVFVWSLLGCIVRTCLSLLVALSTLRSYDGQPGSWWTEMTAVISVVAGWALAVLPSKVASLDAVGFSFGSTWMLYQLRDSFGFIPNLPVRINETVMGRLSLRELAIILPIHFLVPAVAFWLWQLLPFAMITSYATEPVVYAESNPFVVDCMLETISNAFWTVGLLVVPELLRINGIRRWYAIFIICPLYSMGVDADGKPSVFSPNLIYALRCVVKHEEVPITQFSHLLGPILGGILGGKIMIYLFPDK